MSDEPACADVHIVRWAYVEVLMLSEKFQTAIGEKQQNLAANEAVVALLSASPEHLVDLLDIDPLFARRVYEALRANETTRKKH